MKLPVLTKILILLFVPLLTNAQQGVSSPWNDPRFLDLHSHRVDLNSFKFWQNLLQTNFVWINPDHTNGSFGNDQVQEVPLDLLKSSVFETGPYEPSHQIKAIRLYYGFRVDDIAHPTKFKFTLIFAPVLADWNKPQADTPPDPTQTDKYQLMPDEDHQTYYIVSDDHNSFISVTSADVNAWRGNYKTIRINRNNTGNPGDFLQWKNDGLDKNGDDLGEVITINEIDAFYQSGSVFFTSIAKADYQNGITFLKHFIALTNADPRGDLPPSTIAADLGTLCPPGCGSLTIQNGLTNPPMLTAIAKFFASLPNAIQTILGLFSLLGIGLGITWGVRKTRQLFTK